MIMFVPMAHFIKKIIQLAKEYLLDCKTKKEVQIVTLLNFHK